MYTVVGLFTLFLKLWSLVRMETEGLLLAFISDSSDDDSSDVDSSDQVLSDDESSDVESS